jgi:hypothetical protein
VIAAASVIAERAGGQLPDGEPSEQAARWAQLRRDYAYFMPR